MISTVGEQKLPAGQSIDGAVVVVVCIFLHQLISYNAVFLGYGTDDAGVLELHGRQASRKQTAIVFNMLWALTLWSYLRAHCTQPGYINDRWRDFVKGTPGIRVEKKAGRREWMPGVITTTDRSPDARPERAHFCSECQRDVLRMDHHCPLIGNCIGLRNYKFFLQTGAYGSMATLFGIIAMIPEFGVCVADDAVDTPPSALPPWCAENTVSSCDFLLSALLMVCSFVLLISLFLSHCAFACSNITRIEAMYDNMPNPYGQASWFRNLSQSIGGFGWDWLLPVEPRRPLTDGFSYPRVDEDLPQDLKDANCLRVGKLGGPLLAGPLPEALWQFRYARADAELGEAGSEPHASGRPS